MQYRKGRAKAAVAQATDVMQLNIKSNYVFFNYLEVRGKYNENQAK